MQQKGGRRDFSSGICCNGTDDQGSVATLAGVVAGGGGAAGRDAECAAPRAPRPAVGRRALGSSPPCRRLHEPVAVVASLRVPLFSDWHHAPRDAQQCAVTPQPAIQPADRRAWRAQSCYLLRVRLPQFPLTGRSLVKAALELQIPPETTWQPSCPIYPVCLFAKPVPRAVSSLRQPPLRIAPSGGPF